MALSDDERAVEKLASGLESTSKLTQQLLQELKDAEKDFVSVRIEVTSLKEQLKSLSAIVREGNGDMSLLTKIALIEERLKTISAWIERFPTIHKSIEEETSKVETKIESIDRRLMFAEDYIKELKEKDEEKYRAVQQTMSKELELAHEQKLAITKVKEERQVTVVKIIGAIVVAIITFIFGYFTRTK